MRVGSAEIGGLVEVVEYDAAATWRGLRDRRRPARALAPARAARPHAGRAAAAYGVAGAGLSGGIAERSRRRR